MSDFSLEHRLLVNSCVSQEQMAAIIMSHLLNALAYLGSKGICYVEIIQTRQYYPAPLTELNIKPNSDSIVRISAFVERESELIDVVELHALLLQKS